MGASRWPNSSQRDSWLFHLQQHHGRSSRFNDLSPMRPHQQPDWLAQFPRASVEWLTGLAIHHARMVHAAFTQAAAITAQTGQQVMQFEDLDGIDDDADPPPAVPPLPTDASTMDHIRHAAACVWRTPCLRPAQERFMNRFLGGSCWPFTVLEVARV